MKKYTLAVIAVIILFVSQAAAQPEISGIVFSDVNSNGVQDSGEKGVPEVRVSNGRDIVKTDQSGSYKLPSTDFIFIIKPGGWMTSKDKNNLPRFYVENPGATADFPLYKQKEPGTFKAIIFADTQLNEPKHADYLAHDAVEELIGTDAAFGMSLGDLINEKPELYDPLVQVIGQIGIPWHNIKGNHDNDNARFASVYGPSYYSFDYGKVHFVVIDTNQSLAANSDQLTFIKNDLALVPKDQLVVLLMHHPVTETNDIQQVYQVLKSHPYTLSLSGHLHEHQEFFVGKSDGWEGKEPHHHVSNPAVSGLWYKGAPDEVGIPNSIMWDGTPNGYSIITFDGNRYSIRYKVARRPADYQMNIYTPESIKASDAAKTSVLVNVFAGSERSKVEMCVDEGEWCPMKMVRHEDPYYVLQNKFEESLGRVPWDKLWGPRVCTHLWMADLPADLSIGVHLIKIRTTDEYGQTFSGCRVIRVE